MEEVIIKVIGISLLFLLIYILYKARKYSNERWGRR